MTAQERKCNHCGARYIYPLSQGCGNDCDAKYTVVDDDIDINCEENNENIPAERQYIITVKSEQSETCEGCVFDLAEDCFKDCHKNAIWKIVHIRLADYKRLTQTQIDKISVTATTMIAEEFDAFGNENPPEITPGMVRNVLSAINHKKGQQEQ